MAAGAGRGSALEAMACGRCAMARLLPSGELFPCPRCGLELNECGTGPEVIARQVAACAYCRENARRLASGERILPEPTASFPTWESPQMSFPG